MMTPDYFANFFFSRAATDAGTKADTSPPMAAIWRTNVAVIGRTVRRRRQENGLHLRRHGRVHAGHLHLVVEVGGVAQPADQQRRACLRAAATTRLSKVMQTACTFPCAPPARRSARALRGVRRRKTAASCPDARRSPAPACRQGARPGAPHRYGRWSPGRRSRRKGRSAAWSGVYPAVFGPARPGAHEAAGTHGLCGFWPLNPSNHPAATNVGHGATGAVMLKSISAVVAAAAIAAAITLLVGAGERTGRRAPGETGRGRAAPPARSGPGPISIASAPGSAIRACASSPPTGSPATEPRRHL